MSGRLRHRGLVELALGAAVCSLGCAMDLPLEERIISTRPLAVRIEVLEPNAPADAPVRAEALPFERVQAIPFIVDPQSPLSGQEIAEQIEPVWLACPLQPIEGVFSCLTGKLPLDPDDVPECPEISPADFDPSTGALPPFPSPCFVSGGAPERPELTIPLEPAFLLGGDLELTMVGHVPGEGSTASCVEALLTEADDIADSCMIVVQRVAVGPDAALLQLAADFGFADEADLGPIPETIPDPDTHPRIQTFSVTAYEADGSEIGVFEPAVGDTLTLPWGARLEIETLAPEDDLQTYLIARDETGFDERDEIYTSRWFRSWGELLNPTSNDPLSLNTWTLVPGEQDEEETPPGDVATLYYVLRDDRQGVDWFWLQVAVEGEPP